MYNSIFKRLARVAQGKKHYKVIFVRVSLLLNVIHNTENIIKVVYCTFVFLLRAPQFTGLANICCTASVTVMTSC